MGIVFAEIDFLSYETAATIVNFKAILPCMTHGSTVHIRVQKIEKKKKKSRLVTFVQFIGSKVENIDKDGILKELKKKLGCSGKKIEHENLGEVLKFSGDQRENIRSFMKDRNVPEESI